MFGGKCLPWGVDVQDTFSDSDRKCVVMVTAYYGNKLGELLRREPLPQFFYRFSWNLGQMFALGCRCARHIFRQ